MSNQPDHQDTGPDKPGAWTPRSRNELLADVTQRGGALRRRRQAMVAALGAVVLVAGGLGVASLINTAPTELATASASSDSSAGSGSTTEPAPASIEPAPPTSDIPLEDNPQKTTPSPTSPQSTIAPTTSTSSEAPTTIPPSTIAPTTSTSSEAPTTIPPSTIASTSSANTEAPTTSDVPPEDNTQTTIPSTTIPSTTIPPNTSAPAAPASTEAPPAAGLEGAPEPETAVIGAPINPVQVNIPGVVSEPTNIASFGDGWSGAINIASDGPAVQVGPTQWVDQAAAVLPTADAPPAGDGSDTIASQPLSITIPNFVWTDDKQIVLADGRSLFRGVFLDDAEVVNVNRRYFGNGFGPWTTDQTNPVRLFIYDPASGSVDPISHWPEFRPYSTAINQGTRADIVLDIAVLPGEQTVAYSVGFSGPGYDAPAELFLAPIPLK